MTLVTSTSTKLRRMNPTWMWTSLAMWVQLIRCFQVQWVELLVLGIPSSCWEVITGDINTQFTLYEQVHLCLDASCLKHSPFTAWVLDLWEVMPSNVLTCASSGLMLMQTLIHQQPLHQETFMVSQCPSCSKSCKIRWGRILIFIKIKVNEVSWITWMVRKAPATKSIGNNSYMSCN